MNAKSVLPEQGSASGALFGVCLMVLMSTLDMSIVNVCMPTIVEELHTDYATAQWVILSYILVITCLMLTVARLGDMFGKKKLFALGLVIFTGGSLLCGLSSSIYGLIISRGIQGIGATMCQALGLAIVTEVTPPERRGRAIGIIGGTVSMGLTAGPSVGGVLIGLFGWRSVFLVNIPLGIIAFAVFLWAAPNIKPAETSKRFDWIGSIVLFIALGCYCLGMSRGQNVGFTQPDILMLLGIGLAGMIAFLVYEGKIKDPMLDLTMFKRPLFSLNLFMSLLVFIGLAGSFIGPFYLQYSLGYPPVIVGLLMGIVPAGMGIASVLAGNWVDKHGPRAISLFGIILIVAGCLLLSTVTVESGWLGFAIRALPLGFGVGCFQAPNNTAIMSEVPRERLGVASGLLNYSRVFGQTTGLPIVATLFAIAVQHHGVLSTRTAYEEATPLALTDGFSTVYVFAGLFMAVNIVLAIICIKIARRPAR